MNEVISDSIRLNEKIKNTDEYKKYIDTKRALYDNIELYSKVKEFRRRNYELQNRQGVNCFDEVNNLTNEFDELLHNSYVNGFLIAEQALCNLMQQVYNSISDGLEFDFFDE